MANVTHSAITDAYKHEPKGADTASLGQVYLSDGAGSGSWTKLFEKINTTTRPESPGSLTLDVSLSAYRTLILVVNSGDLDGSANVVLQIESGGSFKSSGYEGAALGDSTHTDGVTNGLLLCPGRSDLTDFTGMYFIENTNKSSIVSMSGSCFSRDGSFGNTGTVVQNNKVFSRYNSNATVTDLKIVGSLNRSSTWNIYLYGLRG